MRVRLRVLARGTRALLSMAGAGAGWAVRV